MLAVCIPRLLNLGHIIVLPESCQQDFALLAGSVPTVARSGACMGCPGYSTNRNVTRQAAARFRLQGSSSRSRLPHTHPKIAGSADPRVSTHHWHAKLLGLDRASTHGFRGSWRLSLMLVLDIDRVTADPGRHFTSSLEYSESVLVSWSWNGRRPSSTDEW